MSPSSQNGGATAQRPWHDDGSDEDSPLLGKDTKSSRLHRHMTANISKSWADVALLGLYVITGLLDSSAVFIWGSFVSMQTGNTIYLGLGLVEPTQGLRWIKSLVSIGSFCLGSWFFGNFHRWFSPRQRWVLVTSFSLQTLCIAAAALIVMLGKDVGNGLHWQVVLPLILVAFQSSGQTVSSRVLEYNAMTSVVLTTTYCDLFSDPKLFTGITQNVERNRRAVAPILLLLGSIGGGLFAHSSAGLAGALWTAAGLKGLAAFAWFVWAAEPASDEEDSQ